MIEKGDEEFEPSILKDFIALKTIFKQPLCNSPVSHVHAKQKWHLFSRQVLKV